MFCRSFLTKWWFAFPLASTMVACKWKTCATRRSEIIFEICLGDRIVIETTLHYLPSLKNITIYKQSHKHPVFFFFHFVSRPKTCEKSEGACVLPPLLVVSPLPVLQSFPRFPVFPRTDQRSFQCPSAEKSARSPTYWPIGFGWWNLKEFATSNTETTTTKNPMPFWKKHIPFNKFKKLIQLNKRLHRINYQIHVPQHWQYWALMLVNFVCI